MNIQRRIKIGIDVGGTFTHAVAVDIKDYSIVGKACVPTTHTSEYGVARGVVDSMMELIRDHSIQPEEIILIAHSTTQATNALLEGDVAKVGIVCLGSGIEGKIAKKEANLQDIELSPGKFLPTCFRFIDTSAAGWKNLVPKAIDELKAEGAQVIVASEAFGVDHPDNEDFVAESAASKGFQATAASTISKLYGLKVRTRTAVINASMMPKMLDTANMTEKAVRESGIAAPLMVMRSDGGIMDINEMRKRPILTMLSGPAAGVAAALMYVKISDGIFLEVGGTSTDISVIKNGKPQIKTAQIGKNRLFLRTLDVRTLGIAGGSVPRFDGDKIIDVGPRSAHIAKLKYVSFSGNEDFKNIEIKKTKPVDGDPSDYMAIKPGNSDQYSHTVTPTGASYYLGLVKAVGHGSGNMNNITDCFNSLSAKFKKKPDDLAKEILEISADKIKPVLKQLSREYKLDENLIQFVGGGGGASAIVPFTANYMNAPHQIAENCEVVSAIGAALGIIRDSIERNIINPTEGDLIALRQEAVNSVIRMGALPESVEVTIEIDNQNKKVIATAYGSSEMRTKDLGVEYKTQDEILNIASKSFKKEISELDIAGNTDFFFVIRHKKVNKGFLGFFGSVREDYRIIDAEGTIRLQVNNAVSSVCTIGGIKQEISTLIQNLTTFGDAGALVPDIFIISQSKIVDMTGLILEAQILTVCEIELKDIPDSETVILIASAKQ